MCSCVKCLTFSNFLNIKRQFKIDQDEKITISPRSSLDSGALSCSSGSSISPPTSPTNAQSSVENAVSDCLEAWLQYLMALANLCNSGNRLQQTFLDLEYCDHQSIEQQQQTNSCEQPQTGSPSIGASPHTASTGPWADAIHVISVAVRTVEDHVFPFLRNYIPTSTISGLQGVTPLSLQQQKTHDHQRTRNHN